MDDGMLDVLNDAVDRPEPEVKNRYQMKKLGLNDVNIMRPGKWGNPFVIGKDGSREDVIRKYQEWVVKQPSLMNSLEDLRGKNLVCCCSPKPCHGDVLLELANRR